MTSGDHNIRSIHNRQHKDSQDKRIQMNCIMSQRKPEHVACGINIIDNIIKRSSLSPELRSFEALSPAKHQSSLTFPKKDLELLRDEPNSPSPARPLSSPIDSRPPPSPHHHSPHQLHRHHTPLAVAPPLLQNVNGHVHLLARPAASIAPARNPPLPIHHHREGRRCRKERPEQGQRGIEPGAEFRWSSRQRCHQGSWKCFGQDRWKDGKNYRFC